MRGWTEWDGRTAWRALTIAVVALAIAWLVTATTDEGNVALSERVGRTLPVAPVCAAIGAWLALAPARVRGELRALASLGRSPWQNARAAAIGGASVAAIAGTAIALAPHVDVAGFYPRLGGGSDIFFEDGAFVDRANGWRIERDGVLVRTSVEPAPPDERVPPNGRAAAGLATVVAGLALSMVAGKPERRAAWLVAAGVLGTATLFLFQAAAVRKISAPWAVAPPLVLLAAAAARYSEARWRPK